MSGSVCFWGGWGGASLCIWDLRLWGHRVSVLDRVVVEEGFSLAGFGRLCETD